MIVQSDRHAQQQLSDLLAQIVAADIPPGTHHVHTFTVELTISVQHDATVQAVSPPALTDDPSIHLIEPLTRRENEVLVLLAGGLTNREIAERLVVRPGTVKYYVAQLYGKLQVSSRRTAASHPYTRQLVARANAHTH
jgi:DNA-binding NarL/FixJ family response regulator